MHRYIENGVKNDCKSGMLPSYIGPCQWFLNLLSNQGKASKFAALAWFDIRFKNHLLLTGVVGTHFISDDKLKTTMNMSNRLVDLDLNLI